MNQDNKGYINSIETMGLVDGPGIRFVVFMQGCPLRCLFCHNPETWQKESDFQLTPRELVNKILKYKNYFSKTGGVTFSGGEPLMQPEFLLETLKLCKEYDIVELLGHRDTSPDLDGSGEVEPAEYIKACPCFDVRSEFSNFLRNTVVKP